MKKLGKIVHLFVSQEGVKERVEKNKLTLDEKGITEDKFYNKNIQRSILITSTASYNLALEKNISMPFGTLGENILIDYNPYHLASGSKLHIGDEVILEISQYCTMCEHLSNIDKRLPTLLKNDRGIFAKVVQEGHIKEGDEIYM